jgi:hypothetical protein
MLRFLTRSLYCTLLLLSPQVYSEIRGKVDLAPVYLHVDVLESGKTVKAMHMGGLKGDATVLLWKGSGIKGGFLGASGQGDLISGYVAACHYTPLTDYFSLTPSVGITYSYLRTTINLEHLQLFHLSERFRSSTPYVALEFTYKLAEKWYLMGMYQYGWATTHTKIRTTRKTHFPGGRQVLVSDRSHSSGANYALGIDYTINDSWSVNFGGAYNLMLSREKHGLRGYGFKLGTSYYF